MAQSTLEQKALSLLKTFESAGKTVTRVVVEGRRIEIEIYKGEDRDEFEKIDMRHGKA